MIWGIPASRPLACLGPLLLALPTRREAVHDDANPLALANSPFGICFPTLAPWRWVGSGYGLIRHLRLESGI